MENQQKEQLRKEFEIQYANHPANLFEWFWKRWESIEISNKEKTSLIQQYNKQVVSLIRESSDIEAHYASQGLGLYPKEYYAKLHRQEELIKAADEVIEAHKEVIIAISDAFEGVDVKMEKAHEDKIGTLSDKSVEKYSKYNSLKTKS